MHHGAFGQDTFGRASERGARFFGTPRYIIGQTLVVIAWIALNSAAIALQWDPYPFILEEQLRKAAEDLRGLLQANTEPTGRVERLAQEIHAHLARPR